MSKAKKTAITEAPRTATFEVEELPPGTEIRFRAESDLDVALFMHMIPAFAAQPWSIVSEPLDVEVAFRLKKAVSLQDLRWIASVIPDAHVIVESMNVGELYDGGRDYNGSLNIHDASLLPVYEVLSKAVLYARNFEKFSNIQARAAKEIRASLEKLYSSADYPQI